MKYRVWEVDAKYMNNSVRVTWNSFGIQKLIVEVVEAFGWKEVDSEDLMASTGIEDRHGKEIFKKDILWDPLLDECGYVEYEEGSYIVIWAKCRKPLSEVAKFVSVIGNTYENPERMPARYF